MTSGGHSLKEASPKKMMNKSYYKKILFVVFVLAIGFTLGNYNKIDRELAADNFELDDQSATIMAIKKVIPSVVSIIVYDSEEFLTFDINTGKNFKETENIEIGRGTGFIISSDGYILTNKHVVQEVDERTGQYKIILNSGKQYYAQLIGKDPLNDLAVLKIFDKNLPFVELGESDQIELGTSVVAIGNSLGRYQNSATKGIVSGIGRNIITSDQSGNSSPINNVIQTDAEINPGNSGGPLIDLYGKVIGINVAIDNAGGAVGFSIPINDARPIINSIKESNRIIRPILGVSYIMLNPEIKYEKGIVRDTGALIVKGESGAPAIVPDSPADKAGIKEGDIIFEINAIKIEERNTLTAVVQKYKPGNKIGLKIQRGDKVIIKIVQLEEFK